MLVDTGILNNHHIPRFPIISKAVVDLVTFPIEDVKHGFIHMAVFVRFATRGKQHIMCIEDLRDLFLRSNNIRKKELETLLEFDIFSLDDLGTFLRRLSSSLKL
jgi:hypothetical protein